MSAAEALVQPFERRRSPRLRCFKLARCVFKDGQCDLEVTLRNLSNTGARITGNELICLPDEFELYIHDGFGAFQIRKVRRMWCKGNAAGLAFLDSAKPTS